MLKIDMRAPSASSETLRLIMNDYLSFIRAYAWSAITQAAVEYTDRMRDGCIPMGKPTKRSLMLLAQKLLSVNDRDDDNGIQQDVRAAIEDTIASELLSADIVLDYKADGDDYVISLYTT